MKIAFYWKSSYILYLATIFIKFFLKRPEHCVSKKMLTLFTNLQLRNKRLRGCSIV